MMTSASCLPIYLSVTPIIQYQSERWSDEWDDLAILLRNGTYALDMVTIVPSVDTLLD